jgi:hypothetical protein
MRFFPNSLPGLPQEDLGALVYAAALNLAYWMILQ